MKQAIYAGMILVRMIQEQDKLGNWTWVVEAVSERTGLTIISHRWMGRKRAEKCYAELTEAFGGCLPVPDPIQLIHPWLDPMGESRM